MTTEVQKRQGRFAKANDLTPSQFELLLHAASRKNHEVFSYGTRETTMVALRTRKLIERVPALNADTRAANEKGIADHVQYAQKILIDFSAWEEAYLELKRARSLKAENEREVTVLSEAGRQLVQTYLAESMSEVGK